MQKATIRVCKNCTYFKRISSQSIPLCIHKISCKTDLVTGECTYLTARDMRADNTLCGKEGVLYEQIKTIYSHIFNKCRHRQHGHTSSLYGWSLYHLRKSKVAI